MISYPNAKINLGLSVVRKREDGYHDLQTVFYPVDITDRLEVRLDGGLDCRFHLSGLPLEPDAEKNLVVKAYRMMQQRLPMPGVEIILDKKIPFGAGMGGGSSDAAFTLMMLNELINNPLEPGEIEEIAAKLGADCPFFCRNTPIYAEGIGEKFSDVALSLKGYTMVVVKPPFGVSTKEAFSGIKPQLPPENVRVIVEQDISTWRDQLKNDFETTVFAIYPELASIKSSLYEMGALYAAMSGSGSSVFAIFREPVKTAGRFENCFIWQGMCKI